MVYIFIIERWLVIYKTMILRTSMALNLRQGAQYVLHYCDQQSSLFGHFAESSVCHHNSDYAQNSCLCFLYPPEFTNLERVSR